MKLTFFVSLHSHESIAKTVHHRFVPNLNVLRITNELFFKYMRYVGTNDLCDK